MLLVPLSGCCRIGSLFGLPIWVFPLPVPLWGILERGVQSHLGGRIHGVTAVLPLQLLLSLLLHKLIAKGIGDALLGIHISHRALAQWICLRHLPLNEVFNLFRSALFIGVH